MLKQAFISLRAMKSRAFTIQDRRLLKIGVYSRRAFISYFSPTRVKYSLSDRNCLAADALLAFSATSTPLNLKETW